MYQAAENRYKEMRYNRVGKSGLKLPLLSLGLWHNFGSVDVYENMKKMAFGAFDLGITHFDLANNYGPTPGSAEENFGRILKDGLSPYRDELIISSKAGYGMWPGPYGDGGSRKYIISSCDQSLKRMGLEYVDIFYSHRFDPETPVEETMLALNQLVVQGKTLYVGISNYGPEQTKEALSIARELHMPLIINQPFYSMLNRHNEETGLLDVLKDEGLGSIVFSPLAQGLLTNKYLRDIPQDSRAAKETGFLQNSSITPEVIHKVQLLNQIAEERGQTLAQMAISWVLRNDRVTSALIGASRLEQIQDSIGAIHKTTFTQNELQKIEAILAMN